MQFVYAPSWLSCTHAVQADTRFAELLFDVGDKDGSGMVRGSHQSCS
jgi:hypothetical protein